MSARTRRLILRAGFVVYACALAIATHWPGLTIEADIERPDLYVHVCIYAIWTSLLIAASWFGPALSTRNISVSAVIALTWSAVDELTQSLPPFHRHSTLSDLVANIVGVAAATAVFFGASAALRVRRPDR